jgi:hypothetical protein
MGINFPNLPYAGELYPDPAIPGQPLWQYNGTTWIRIDSGSGGGGAASSITFAPGGNISATDVQAAILELDTEKAPLASPTFTGDPKAPTPTVGDNDTSVATTAFVASAVAGVATVPPATVAPIMDSVAAVGTTTKYAREDHVHPSDTSRAPLASPALTGTPTAPTATAGTSTTQIATTAFVQTAGATGSVRYDIAQGLTASQKAQARANIDSLKKNYIVNGAMQINQGSYVSGTVLAASAYGHDQWKAGASGGDYSFTQSTGSTTITIAAGKSLIQPIEDVRVTGGGNYVLAWTGTAQARAGVNTLTPLGAYAASPLLITGQTDGTVMSVEFNTGTLSNVGLYEGTVAPTFQVPDYASELALCKRYWQRIQPDARFYAAAAGANFMYTYFGGFDMRTAPTSTIIANGSSANASAHTATAVGSNRFGEMRIQLSAIAVGDCYSTDRVFSLNARL